MQVLKFLDYSQSGLKESRKNMMIRKISFLIILELGEKQKV